MRERLQEIYGIVPMAVVPAINDWKNANQTGRHPRKVKMPEFKASGNLENAKEEYMRSRRRAMIEEDKRVIRSYSTDRDAKWMLEQTIENLTDGNKKAIQQYFADTLIMKGEPKQEVWIFISLEYNLFNTNKENIKSYNKWKRKILQALPNVG